jgi:uncharacterized protein YndB with AHSA1/START domain
MIAYISRRAQVKDSVEREVLIAASPERVWEVITTPEHISGWLWDFAEIDLRVGGAMSLAGTYQGKPFSYEATIEHLDPPHVFAFQWAEDDWVEGGSTRVEITLTAEDGGTRLRLVESGFAGLQISDERRNELFGDISHGWKNELGHLVAYVEGLQVRSTVL